MRESPIISCSRDDQVAQNGIHLIMMMICCIISRMFSFEIVERIQNETKAQSFGWSVPHTRRVTRVRCDDPACCLPPRFLSDSVLFPQPLILYPAFQFLLLPFYLRSSRLWPQLPPGNSSSGVNRGARPLPSHSGVRRTVIL